MALLFSEQRGIVVACDVFDLNSLKKLLSATASLPFICGYKVGMELALAHGLDEVLKTIRQVTTKPVIYDHQKFGTDIPDICGGRVLDLISRTHVDAVIVFPLSGIETLRATVEGCYSRGIEPIVGGDMTHKGYLAAEGGYIEDDAPIRIYRDAAALSVRAFIVPGTRLASIRQYREIIEATVSSPSYLFPGIGKGQGGDIVEALVSVAPHSGYAIVGRGIYAEPDPAAAALTLWTAVRERFGK